MQKSVRFLFPLLALLLFVPARARAQEPDLAEEQAVVPAPAAEPVKGTLKVEIFDTAAGKPTPARVRLQGADGTYYEAENAIRVEGKKLEVFYKSSAGKEDLFYSPPEFAIALKPGKYDLLVEKGFEYRPWEKEIEIKPGETAAEKATLERWIDLPAEGWMSGDYHQHFGRMLPGSSELVLEVMKAEDLKISWLLQNKSGGKYREEQPAFGERGRADADGYSIHAGEEFLNDDYGHMAFINIPELIKPMATGRRGGISPRKPDYPPNYEIARQAKAAGATVIACHGGHGEFAIDLYRGVIDAIDVLQGNKWQRDVGNEELLLPHWYRALNCGFKIPGTAASDFPYLTHQVVNLECDYVYVKNDFSPRAWLEGFRQGRFFFTNGPMALDFTVDGKMMGETIELKRPGKRVKVEARVRSLYPLTELEIVRNGVVVQKVKNPEKSLTIGFRGEIPVYRSSWIAARAVGEHPDKIRGKLYLHGNPVYVELRGRPVLVPDAAAWWVDRIDDLIAWTEKEAFFERREDRESTLKQFRQGKRYYEKLAGRGR